MPFGVYPSGTPAPNPETFPTFIQWQQDSENLGGPDADTVNLTGGLTGTRGVGENENVLTLTAMLQVTAGGVEFPLPVTGLDISTGITATQDSITGIVTLTTEAPPEFVWREVVDDDAIVELSDVSNGISMNSASDHVVTVPDNVLLPGRSVLVMQKGAGAVTFASQSGVDLEYRAVFSPGVAEQFGIVTLIGQNDGSVLLCGDMATA